MPPDDSAKTVAKDADLLYMSRREYFDKHTDLMVHITALEGDMKNIRENIENLENLLNERAKALNAALDKAETALEIKLEGMNEFRRQLDRERGGYVTAAILDARFDANHSEQQLMRAKLESDISSIKKDIDGIKETLARIAGSYAGVKTLVVILISTIAAISAVALVILR